MERYEPHTSFKRFPEILSTSKRDKSTAHSQICMLKKGIKQLDDNTMNSLRLRISTQIENKPGKGQLDQRNCSANLKPNHHTFDLMTRIHVLILP